jgi:hypothetical protein
MKKYESKIKDKLASGETIFTREHWEDELRKDFDKLNRAGKLAVTNLIDRTVEYLQDVDKPDWYESKAISVIKEVKKEKRMYFEDYLIIRTYLDMEDKLRNNKVQNTDDDYIVL